MQKALDSNAGIVSNASWIKCGTLLVEISNENKVMLS
jgi:hypothetical protein